MKKTPYHLTPGASQGNAFTRHMNGEPSVFCSKANPDRGAAKFTVRPGPTTRQLESRQQIAYSRAKTSKVNVRA